MSASSLPTDLKVLVGAFLVSGTVHLVRPETFEPLMPEMVPAHREVIYASGVAELALRCRAAAPAHPSRRRLGERRGAARRLPGQPEDGRRRAEDQSTAFKAVSLARLPLQLR